jgi:phosphoglycolate phosphatase-like HAD superfamily hydrolase
MSHARSLAIIDFDNTLFKTREFWREHLFPAYQKQGIHREKVEEAFNEATQKKADYFVIDYFITSLADRTTIPYDQLLETFTQQVFSHEASDYLYPGSKELVAAARGAYDDLLLVSYGDHLFKDEFFKHSGMTKLFKPEEIIITKERKAQLIGRLPNYKFITIVNDVLEETQEMIREAARKKNTARGYVVDHQGTMSRETGFQIEVFPSLSAILNNSRFTEIHPPRSGEQRG